MWWPILFTWYPSLGALTGGIQEEERDLEEGIDDEEYNQYYEERDMVFWV
jgi:hypothetical protein